jgi:GTP cyclohydrolase III
MTDRERDYSHRSLFEKLGVVAEAHVALVGRHEEAFTTELNARLAKAASLALRTRYDLIFLRVDEPRDLDRLARTVEHLKPSGALWVFHPKGRGASPSDAEVRSSGIAAGLVDNKISAYSESHTATRFVIPLKLR